MSINRKDEIKTLQQYLLYLDAMKSFIQKLINEENAVHSAPTDAASMVREITDLRMLSKTEQWPESYPEEDINKTEEEKLHGGALLINELIKTDLSDKNVLFYGCGEGHAGYVMHQLFNTRKVICYDLSDNNWNHFDKCNGLVYTTDLNYVKSQENFDIIVLNDVIDHMSDIEKTLKEIAQLKNKKTKIFVRCHPYTSRDGCHLSSQINKAYLHLVFDHDELFKLGYKPYNTNKYINPMKTYKKLFEDAGLKIESEKVKKANVELFFTLNPAILRRIKENFKESDDQSYSDGKSFPRDILEIQSVDFILT